MKCIHCGNSTTYPVRRGNSGRCGSCSHPFAFEPKTDVNGMADTLFQKLIKDVSGDGKLSFTAKQLWYEFNRKILKKRVVSCGGATSVLILGLILARTLHSVGPGLIGLALAALCLMATTPPVKKPAAKKPTGPQYVRVPWEPFLNNYLARWQQVHGPIEKLLPPPSNAPWANASAAPDVTAYSFDRVLVTEHAEVAAMLVANNFHFENNCAILSLNGYPFGKFDTILQMLRRNPQLKIFALHDATPGGNAMALQLRTAQWFSDPSLRIIDLGLRPLHAIKANMVMLKVPPAPMQPTGHSSLTAEELNWLAAGNRAEVEAVRPAKLMRAIYQGFARANQVGDDGQTVYDDSGGIIWIYDGGVDVYASDSFG